MRVEDEMKKILERKKEERLRNEAVESAGNSGQLNQ